MNKENILIEPWITEAATASAELNKYIFKVNKKADKKQIKKAIEELYKVTVLGVRTINIPGKKRTRGRIVGVKSGFKKAIIKIKEGESIDVFSSK
ncbi:MAG: 50S ribosomal protein L23 [Candidatus Moranbacteria bacterium RIFOXYA12_FULL_35_19]|nr:MAG: 50S ribosomal protein L23 [Candidatus Moranbacteria bacterium GW2011_GWF2_35_39]OGI31347.1 MAG: 50S ribosomal protein L23 [Candidatus Moranbacteria bacterium RIFOXYB12_FULL_35_8]OGI32851.1 MAG: 50S ribosomal protein L23 [Candidatus Moranbacteria bacterium RIFOXYC12_FULL_36_13]OGI36179.1 MAG: 50S ribosomal protein L23 [Candidatus Moranbacteria bacterium RIFOXYA12_FULL_35_19]PIP28621.1 MAG: 50S ribosomal protein L23 [Candidatus Moranbacteria bacterium CG23_combo_of_CG06-09_8_20_14_all_35_